MAHPYLMNLAETRPDRSNLPCFKHYKHWFQCFTYFTLIHLSHIPQNKNKKHPHSVIYIYIFHRSFQINFVFLVSGSCFWIIKQWLWSQDLTYTLGLDFARGGPTHLMKSKVYIVLISSEALLFVVRRFIWLKPKGWEYIDTVQDSQHMLECQHQMSWNRSSKQWILSLSQPLSVNAVSAKWIFSPQTIEPH